MSMGMGQSQWPNIWIVMMMMMMMMMMMQMMMDEAAPFLKQNQLCFPS